MIFLLHLLAKVLKPKERQVSIVRKLGYKKPKKDKRDFKFLGDSGIVLPKKISLRQYVIEIKNQGWLSSCSCHAVTSVYEIMRNIKNGTQPQTSERWLYYNVRKDEGTFPNVTGSYLRDNLKILNKKGIAYEIYCPYSENDYNIEPGFLADFSAGYNKIKAYYFLYSIEDIKNALAQNKPVAFGVKIFENFDNLNPTEILTTAQGKLRGGHAMTIIEFDDDKEAFLVLNSWGKTFDDNGFCWISYDYIDNYCFKEGYEAAIMELY